MSDEATDFVEVGRQAFHAGEPGIPTLNATVREAIKDMAVGTGAVDIFLDFQKGWTEANFATGITVHFEHPTSPGKVACASRNAEPLLTDNPRAVTCWPCRDTEDWRSYADMAEFADMLPEATDTEPDKIVILREVRDKFSARKIEGVPVDPQTANAILTVYDAEKVKAHPNFRERFAALPILRMAEVAWKLVKPSRP
ncbi:hypothetical protein AB5J62_33795 [Amycolatopsis sp. cg5]|uniref:hypothetical protein n=1 Tax=Amycolatopsis sp. cg5 TaxID=3238802 RepID=UPI003525DC68